MVGGVDGTPIISSSWVKIKLCTENQLPRLPGSALEVPGGVGWVPTHYQVKLQLMLMLSWAVTIRKFPNDDSLLNLESFLK